MPTYLTWFLAVLGAGPDLGPIELGHRSSLIVTHSAVNSVGDHVDVQLTLYTDHTDARDRFITLRIPRELHIIGLRLSNGSQRLEAKLVEAAPARTLYRKIVRPVESRRDPALLEWMASTTDVEHYRLRVFPVVRGQPMRIHLELDRTGDGVGVRRSLLAIDGRGVVSAAPDRLSPDDRIDTGSDDGDALRKLRRALAAPVCGTRTP